MHKYIIYDVWTSLRMVLKNLIPSLIIAFILIHPFSEASLWINNNSGILVIIISGILNVLVYSANFRYVVDLESGLITFPASDLENSILAIILLKPYWNLYRVQKIHISQLENSYIDTQRWSTTEKIYAGAKKDGFAKFKNKTTRHIRYNLNIVGTFGSANLKFLSRQKRDEVRNALNQCSKLHNKQNIDRKVAEFN